MSHVLSRMGGCGDYCESPRQTRSLEEKGKAPPLPTWCDGRGGFQVRLTSTDGVVLQKEEFEQADRQKTGISSLFHSLDSWEASAT